MRFNNKNVALPTSIYNKNAYIQFSNATSFSDTAYFETETKLKNTYTVEIKIKTPENNGNRWRQVLGDYNDWNTLSGSLQFALYTNANNNYFGMIWWNYGISTRLADDDAFAMAANTEYIIKIHVGTGVTYINGVLLSASGGTNGNGTLSNNMRIGSGYTGDPGFNGQIYYVKVTEGNTLIAYYEANNENNTPGFVNRKTGIKYTKFGGGSVTYGEDA